MVDSVTRIHTGEGEERLLQVVLCVSHIRLCTHAYLPLVNTGQKIKEQYRAVKQGGGIKGEAVGDTPEEHATSVWIRWVTDRDMATKFPLLIVVPMGWVC